MEHQHMHIHNQSHQVAQAIASICPEAMFCGFKVKQKQDGKWAKLPFNLQGQGVGADTPPDQLITGLDLANMTTPPGGEYWGVVMQKPIFDPFGDLVLTVLDLDAKNSSAPRDVRMEKLIANAKAMGLMTERSHSKKGGHIIFLCKPDATLPPKISLGNHQEIEIFGHPQSGGKSVMLTGDMLRGKVVALNCSLRELLNSSNIAIVDKKESKASVVPSQGVVAPVYASNDMERAAHALSFISPDIEYHTWISLGQALQAGFGEAGFSIWNQWSCFGTKYKGENDLYAHWKSFKGDRGINLGTLFFEAKSFGYEIVPKQQERQSAKQDFAAFIATKIDPETGELLDSVQPEMFWNDLPLDFAKVDGIDYLLEGFMAESFAIISGQPGVGKTTAMVPLALAAAGFTIGCLQTNVPRQIIYVSEDSAQVKRILYGMVKFEGLDADKVRQMFHLIDAKRVIATDLIKLRENVAMATVNGVRPWVILDTASATMHMDNENSNSEVSAFVSALKETIYTQQKTSVAIITHQAKAMGNMNEDATARGGSAWEGDATLTASLFIDSDERFLKLRKTRYEPEYKEIKLNTRMEEIPVIDSRGNMQDMRLLWTIPEPSDTDERKLAKRQNEESEKHDKQTHMIDEIHTEFLNYVNMNGPVCIRTLTGKKQAPEGYQTLKLKDWIKPHLPSNCRSSTKAGEIIAALKTRLPAADDDGFVLVKA